MLDICFRHALFSGKGCVDSDDSVFFKPLKLISVNKIPIVPASKIEMSLTERFPLPL